MPAQTVRGWVEAQLKPLLPSTWRLVPYQRNLDELNQVTVMLRLQRVVPLDEAPNGAWRAEWTLTIIHPGQDVTRAQKLLDQQLFELLNAIRDVRATGQNIDWSDAQSVVFGDRYEAFDLTIRTILTKQ
jgi:hypothetical protein